jgi:hypothetical protein
VRLLDDRGRVGGRFNVVDAIAAILLVILIPIAYGAYLLFRTPTPTLVSIVPAMLFEGSKQRVEIDGANLRPFMRVSFDTTPARSFLLGSTKYALVDLPELKPGAYDVVLYDYMQEVARLPKALTIAPIATDVELEVVGAFKSPSDRLAANLKVGDRFPPGANAIAEVIAVGAPTSGDLRLRVGGETVRVASSQRELPATLRVKCYSVRAEDGTARCVVPTADERVAVAPDALLTLSTPQGSVLFQIASARAPKANSPTADTR